MLSFPVRAQGLPDALEIARRMVDAGALRTALARVDQQQPAAASALRWGDWEQLRCALMFRLNLHQELAQRVAALPAAAPPEVVRSCHMHAARAAVVARRGHTARELLATVLWRQAASTEELRQARLLIIESYLVESMSKEAYALMLRFQQDYSPLDRDVAARFVDALLNAGMGKEAVNWLSLLDEANPAKLVLRMQTNLVPPEAVVLQARAGIAKSNSPIGYWRILQTVAASTRNAALNVEALENLLQLAEGTAPDGDASLSADLWKGYAAAALELANQEKLLIGDEANWADFGARRNAANPAIARAFFAYLALSGKQPGTRESAQLQLVYSLQTAKLPLTAVRLFRDATHFPVTQIDPQARFLIGSMAAENNLQEVAVRFWSGLKAPPNLDADEWNLRLAHSLVRAGKGRAGAESIRALIGGRKELSAELLRRAMVVVAEIHDGGDAEIAGTVYREMLPLAASRERREILFGIARNAESTGDFRRAADHYLESALMGEVRLPDSFAINARMAAAASLGRAGFKDDARAQYGWILKNVKDVEKQELARREMQKL